MPCHTQCWTKCTQGPCFYWACNIYPYSSFPSLKFDRIHGLDGNLQVFARPSSGCSHLALQIICPNTAWILRSLSMSPKVSKKVLDQVEWNYTYLCIYSYSLFWLYIEYLQWTKPWINNSFKEGKRILKKSKKKTERALRIIKHSLCPPWGASVSVLIRIYNMHMVQQVLIMSVNWGKGQHSASCRVLNGRAGV